MKILFVKQEGRGRLTPENIKYYFEKTQRELSQVELRLIPYMVSMFLSGKKLNKLNNDEIELLKSLNDQGFINFKRTHHSPYNYDIEINREFYFICNEILYISYACKAEGEVEDNIYSNRYIKNEFLEKNKDLLLKLKNSFQDGGILRLLDDKLKKYINKKELSTIEKFKKAGFIYFEEIEEGKFQVGTTKLFWEKISDILYDKKNVEK